MKKIKLKPCLEILKDKKRIIIFNLITGARFYIRKEVQPSFFLLRFLEKGDEKNKIIFKIKKQFPSISELWIKKSIKNLNKLKLLDPPNSFEKDLQFTNIFKYFDREFYYFSALEKGKINRYKIIDVLRKAHILILGVGSMGQWLIPALISNGLENFTIVDFDKVEEKNLVSQPLFKRKDIGKLKIDSVANKMKDMNPSIYVDKINKLIRKPQEVEEIIKNTKPDLVIHCCDIPRFIIHRIITKACLKTNTPNLVTHAGKVGPFNIPYRTACYGCLEEKTRKIFPEYELLVKKLANTPTRRFPGFPVTSAITGTISAKEIIIYLAGINKPRTFNRIIVWNPNNSTFIEEPVKKTKNCKICGKL